MHRTKTCFKNAIFNQELLVCGKCGKSLGIRYINGDNKYIALFYPQYRYLLPEYDNIPEKSPIPIIYKTDYLDMKREIKEELSSGLNINSSEDDDFEEEPEEINFDLEDENA